MGNKVIHLNERELKRIIKDSVFEATKKPLKVGDIDIRTLFNFDNIPEEELEKQYVDLSFTVSSAGYGGKFMGVNGKILKEEATSTLTIDETRKEIQAKFHLKDWQFATQNGANGIQLVILYPGIFRNTRLIKRAMSACGWSLAVKGHVVKNKMIWRAMSFDPMFQKNVSMEARKYRFLYHWTPLYCYDNIKENGLLPKSENAIFDYPDRLHLIKGDTNNDEIMNIGQQLYLANKNKKNKGDYILLMIDLKLVPENVEFYYDPRYEWGYYTKTSILPEALTCAFACNFKRKEEIKL